MTKKPLTFNPWAREPAAPPTRPPEPVDPSKPAVTPLAELEADDAARVATINIPSFGLITVRGAANNTEAVTRILDYLVRNERLVDPTLVEYGVLLVRLPAPPEGGFYVHRSTDGWTLSIPGVTTKEQALLQIFQALRALQQPPLRTAGITVTTL